MGKTLPWAAALLAAVISSFGSIPLVAADRVSGEPAIEKTLDGPARVDFDKTSLWEVVDHLKDAHGVEIQFDNRPLFESGIDPSELRITKDLKRCSLRSALNLMLRDVGLTFVVEDEVVLITTPEAAAGRITTRLYPVADLIDAPDAAERQRRREALSTTITASIDPASWQAAGGLGAVVYSELGDGPALVVSQSYTVHRRIADFLESQRRPVALVREATAALRGSPGKTIYRVGVSVAEEKAAEKIEEILSQPTEFEFVELPLPEVVESIRKRHQVNIVIDRQALEDVGLDASTIPITQSVKGITLRSALRLTLRELDLTTMVENEVLLVTTPEEADIRLEVRVYVVGDLAGTRPAGKKYGGYAADYGRSAVAPPKIVPPGQSEVAPGADALADIIYHVIEPLSWEEAGGEGIVDAFSIDGTDALIVANTFEVHEQIAHMLDQLREIKSPPSPPAETDDFPASEPSDPFGPMFDPFDSSPPTEHHGDEPMPDPFGSPPPLSGR